MENKNLRILADIRPRGTCKYFGNKSARLTHKTDTVKSKYVSLISWNLALVNHQ